MTGIAAVQERIGELRTLMGQVATATTASSTAASTASAASFAQALQALGGTDGADLTSLLGGLTGTTGPTGQSLVDAAERYLGVPYVWGGEQADGVDCSGLVQLAMKDLGVDVPRTAREQMTLGTAVPTLAQAQPGDLVVFGGGSHIGIYVGDGKMIDAPKPGRSVVVRDVYEAPTAVRRVLPQASAADAGLAGGALATAQRTALDLLAGVRA